MLAIFLAFMLYTFMILIALLILKVIYHYYYVYKVKNTPIGTVFYSKECVNNPFESRCSFLTVEEIKKNNNGNYYVLIKDQDGTENVMQIKELFTNYTTKSKYE